MIEFFGDIKEMIDNYFIFPYFYEKIARNHWRIKAKVMEAYYLEFHKELNLYFYACSSFYNGATPYGTLRKRKCRLIYISFYFMPLKIANFQVDRWTFFIQDMLKSPLRHTIFFYIFHEKKRLLKDRNFL